MKKKTDCFIFSLTLFLLFFVFLCFSCTKDDIQVVSSDIRPFITLSSRMGISFWVNIAGYDNAVTVELRSPDDEFSWSLKALTTDLDGLLYTGSSNAVMPLGLDIPQGEWTYTVVFKDGRVLEDRFEIYYTDKEGALYRAEKEELPYYDVSSNLTVIDI